MARVEQHTGKIADWNDARGFGFITDEAVQGRVFVHIKDFERAGRRPSIGDEVTYRLIAGREGKPAASLVRFTAAAAPSKGEVTSREAPMRVTVRIVGALVLATTVSVCVIADRAPIWLLFCYAIAGVVSFVGYRADKLSATRGEWRTMELELHAFDLAFGIVGGLFAQGVLRHKSSKPSFGLVTAAIFALHMAGLLLLLAGYGPNEWLAWLSA